MDYPQGLHHFRYWRCSQFLSPFRDSPMKKEQWKTVDGYDEMYEVSDMGNVRSWKTTRGRRLSSPRTLTPLTDHLGRKSISLWKNNREKRTRVHRLVLTAFVGKCPDGMECCHYDGNPSNNNMPNLRWDTHRNNYLDMKRHGRSTGNKPGCRTYSKVTEGQVREIREIGRTKTLREIASMYPIETSQVSNILLNISWKNV